MHTQTNLYEVLEVSPHASPLVIRAAYRYLAQFHHPDKWSNASDAGDRLKLINHAYSVLSDPDQRRLYDEARQRLQPALDRRGSGTSAPLQTRPDRSSEVSRPFVFRPLR